jgi:hypothetical protein
VRQRWRAEGDDGKLAKIARTSGVIIALSPEDRVAGYGQRGPVARHDRGAAATSRPGARFAAERYEILVDAPWADEAARLLQEKDTRATASAEASSSTSRESQEHSS